MICKVKKAISKFLMLEDTEKVVVGFSGGADSVCLLHILNLLKDEHNFIIHAAHVNHCLRGEESERDERFVRDFCAEYGIELSVLRVDVSQKAKELSMSIEEYGRKVRYDFFQSLCNDKTKIATAHNLNDCEETFIFNFVRGASLNGLTSIPPVRDNIIRPIIECSRDEIELYCKENNLDFVTDSSNLSDDYTRNKIRHNIIPVLKDINPSFDKAALRCIDTLREDNDYLTARADKLFNDLKLSFGYDAEKIKQAERAVAKRVISAIIKEKCDELPEKRHIDLVINILDGGKVQLFDKETLVVRKGIMYFLSDVRKRHIINETVVFDADGTWTNKFVKLELTENNTQNVYKELLLSTFDYDKIIGNLVLRKRKQGDKINLPLRKVTKTLKKLFNELEISPEERENVLVLADDKSVVWVENVGVDARLAPTTDSKKLVNIILTEDVYA